MKAFFKGLGINLAKLSKLRGFLFMNFIHDLVLDFLGNK